MEMSPIFSGIFSDKIDDPRYYQIYGGRGSGKSVAVALAAVLKTYNKHRVLYLRQTMDSQEDSTIAEVRKVLDLLNAWDDFGFNKGKFYNKRTGGTIAFKGIQTTGSKTAKLKSLSGITTVILEEAEEIQSFDEFSKIDEGIREMGKNLKLILVYNPGSALTSWIHDEWFIDGKPNPDRFHDTVYIHSTYMDNLKNLPLSTLRRYEDLRKAKPQYYKHVILAEWTIDASNRIYDGWYEIEEMQERGDVWYGLDFGYGGKDRTALIEINYFEGAYYIRQLVVKDKLLNSELITMMKRLRIPKSATIYADSAVPNFITEIRNSGYARTTPVKKVSNGVEQGIKKVQDMEIIIVGENPELYKDYLTFRRNDNGSLPHEPDTMAALRYGLTSKNTRTGGTKVSGGSSVVRVGRY